MIVQVRVSVNRFNSRNSERLKIIKQNYLKNSKSVARGAMTLNLRDIKN